MRKFAACKDSSTPYPWLSTPGLAPGPPCGFALAHRARFSAICVHPWSSTTISPGLRPPAELTADPHTPRQPPFVDPRAPHTASRHQTSRPGAESAGITCPRSPARRIKRFVVASSVPRTWGTLVGCTVDQQHAPPSNRISGKRNARLARRPWGLAYGRARAVRLVVVPFRLDVASLVLP